MEGIDDGLHQAVDGQSLGEKQKKQQRSMPASKLSQRGSKRGAFLFKVKGTTPGPRKQSSAGQGLIDISVITETGDSWEGWCSGVSRSAKSPEMV